PPSSTLFPYTTLFRSGIDRHNPGELPLGARGANRLGLEGGVPQDHHTRPLGHGQLPDQGGGPVGLGVEVDPLLLAVILGVEAAVDRKSTRLNSSHVAI